MQSEHLADRATNHNINNNRLCPFSTLDLAFSLALSQSGSVETSDVIFGTVNDRRRGVVELTSSAAPREAAARR